MASGKRKADELSNDYRILSDMSKSLSEHRKHVKAATKSIAKRMKSSFKYGLIDNLDNVAEHMEKAQKELDKARKQLELV